MIALKSRQEACKSSDSWAAFLSCMSALQAPSSCTGVPSEILNPASQWKNKGEYSSTLQHLAELYKVPHLFPRFLLLGCFEPSIMACLKH